MKLDISKGIERSIEEYDDRKRERREREINRKEGINIKRREGIEL